MSETIEIDESHSHGNPQTALLISLENDHLEEFQYNLNENIGVSIDVNHLYEDADNKSLLEIACSCRGKTKFVELLLQYGADVNRLNLLSGKAPIHLAVLHSDYNTLKLLVENENTDVNKPDTSGHTALYLASQQGREDLVSLLQKHMASEGYKNNRFQTSIIIDPKDEEEALMQDLEYPDSSNSSSICDNPDFLAQKDSGSSEESLMVLLYSRNYEAFAIKANENNVRHDKNAFRFTYLQYACKFGLTSFVKLLLDLKVDPNETSSLSKKPPIMLAAYNRHYDIVKMLADTQNIAYCVFEGDNILHAMFLGKMMDDSHPGDSHSPIFGSKHQDFYKCLEHLLTNEQKSQFDVNLVNQRGKTVLHYAVLADIRDVIKLLLENGAYIGITNSKGEMPIKFMKAATLEYFLDAAISSKGHFLRQDHAIILNYNLLVRKSFDSQSVTETKPLVAISEVPHLRPLLKHPFFTAFLDLKWYIIMKKLTLANYFFYTLFVLFLSSYLLMDYVPITNNVTIGLQNNTPTASQNKTIPPNLHIEKHEFNVIQVILWYIVIILNSILFLRELLQFVVYSNSNKYRYIKKPENWIEVALIAITFVILFARIDSTENRSLLSVTAIFLSWIELMLLILSHPITSVQVTMFKAVAWNSFKFLLCYSILIVAFALSFYLLFKDTSSEFKDIVLALFKTSIMSAGEYEMSNNPFHSEFGIRHVLFILFIFLVPIVLFNLLNGVAISDIQGIRNNAELVSIVARIKLIAHIEEVIADLFSFLDERACISAYHHNRRRPFSRAPAYYNQLKKRYYQFVDLFSSLSEDGKVFITPNLNNAIFMNYRELPSTNKPNAYWPTPILSISASTIESIKEKLSQRAGHSVSQGQGIPEERQAVENLQQEFKSHSIVVQNRLQIIEQKLAEITELLIKEKSCRFSDLKARARRVSFSRASKLTLRRSQFRRPPPTC